MQTLQLEILGLYPDSLRVDNLRYFNISSTVKKIAIGGRADSYYEYLLKLWLSTGEEKYLTMYYTAAQSIAEKMVVKSAQGHLYVPAGFIKEFVKSSSKTKANGKVDSYYYVEHEMIFEHL
ncbi:hypothetical protein HK100_008979, partial [Physocladia obscura]